MKKYVYLYELDSVRNSKEEIIKGQKAMYEEIVTNGNIIVLTYNQLTDSRAFLAAIKDEKHYENILELFRLGAIKVSRFSNIRTPSQYIQKKIDDYLINPNSTFIFSAFPYFERNDDLPKVIKDALQFSDPDLISDYASKIKEDTPILKKRKEDLVFIKKFIQLVLDLSTLFVQGEYSEIVISNKDSGYVSFAENMEIILENLKNSENALKRETAVCLTKIWNTIENPGARNSRSVWLRKLDVLDKKESVLLSEAVVDICYNITVENNIENVARHYQLSEDDRKKDSFLTDFDRRLKLYWIDYKMGIHQFYVQHVKDTDDYEPAVVKTEELPQWDIAQRTVKNFLVCKNDLLKINKILHYFPARKIKKVINEILEEKPTDARYEDNYESEKKKWKWIKLIAGAVAVATIIFYLFITVIVNGVVDLFACGFDFKMWIASYKDFFSFSNILVFGGIGSWASARMHCRDYLQLFKDLWEMWCDLRHEKKIENVAYINMDGVYEEKQ